MWLINNTGQTPTKTINKAAGKAGASCSLEAYWKTWVAKVSTPKGLRISVVGSSFITSTNTIRLAVIKLDFSKGRWMETSVKRSFLSRSLGSLSIAPGIAWKPLSTIHKLPRESGSHKRKLNRKRSQRIINRLKTQSIPASNDQSYCEWTEWPENSERENCAWKSIADGSTLSHLLWASPSLKPYSKTNQ